MPWFDEVCVLSFNENELTIDIWIFVIKFLFFAALRSNQSGIIAFKKLPPSLFQEV